MKVIRHIGSLAFVAGLFTVVFAVVSCQGSSELSGCLVLSATRALEGKN